MIAGPWDDEPNLLQWTDKATGLPCLVRRNMGMLNLCGYVGVPEGHPMFGAGDDRCGGLDVHGGVTYTASCRPEIHVCHPKKESDPETWWIGFDCAHFGDLIPGMLRHHPESGTYRTIEYVRNECESLARQLHQKGLERDEKQKPF